MNYGLSESKNRKKSWSSIKCFNFLNQFMDFVKEVVKKEDEIFEFYKIDNKIVSEGAKLERIRRILLHVEDIEDLFNKLAI